MSRIIRIAIIVFVVCNLFACHENRLNDNVNRSLEDFATLSEGRFVLSPQEVNKQLLAMSKSDRDTMLADAVVKRYYREGGGMLWVTKLGLTPQADTLLLYINNVEQMGFSADRFRVKDIAADVRLFRSFDFAGEDVSTVAARLDYNLTKAYLLYAAGQRYGFVNPYKVLNKLDRDEDDTLNVRFRQLYDDNTETINKEGYHHLMSTVRAGRVAEILREAQPSSPLYHQLMAMLSGTVGVERERILVNMERCRWRKKSNPFECSKYTVVNIPAYTLYAVDGGETITMKVVCGSRKTKTPLLHSNIKRMDLNPKWVMPPSVVKKEIALHAGDGAYFRNRNYFITEKSTGDRIEPEDVTYEDFQSGRFRVAQEGGEGNALGRIIFRFDNNFSIYLHDTSSKGAFGNIDRSISHGCVRVEKPFDFARYLLENKDETVLEKIEYSMNVRTKVPAEEDENKPEYKVDKTKIIHSLPIKPEIPVFIVYHTLYPQPDGRMATFDDVYGYDRVMAGILRDYR